MDPLSQETGCHDLPLLNTRSLASSQSGQEHYWGSQAVMCQDLWLQYLIKKLKRIVKNWPGKEI